MPNSNLHKVFFEELKNELAGSTGAQRKSWAEKIVREDFRIVDFVSLLSNEPKAASHFLWLVSDVCLLDRDKMLAELPELFQVMEQHHSAHLNAFASWWHYAGVPEKDEAKAIDYLFKWFLSSETASYIKTRALWVLVELSKKYPDLKQELRLSLVDQMDKYSGDFKKRAQKILKQFES